MTKIVIKNLADLQRANIEYDKSVDKDMFIENVVFDTDVEFDKETGATKLSLDLQDILGNGEYTNFAWYVLENTMKNSFKNKKSKALFINTVMRKIGMDMVVDSRANVTLYGKQTYNTRDDVLWFVNGMISSRDRSLLDSDAMVVYNIIERLSSELTFNGMRFDADNPLHQKLARIVIPLEKQGYARFKGFEERWLHDTQSSNNLIKKEKNENDLVANVQAMSIDEMYAYYLKNKGKFDDAQGMIILDKMIDIAPADQKWGVALGDLLPSYNLRTKNKKTKAVQFHDDYKVIEHFSKKYNIVMEELLKDLEKKQDGLKEANAELEAKNKECNINKDKLQKLQQKQKKWQEFFNNLSNVLSEFHNEIHNIDGKSEKEKKFYTDISQQLNQMIQNFERKHDNSDLAEIKIDSKPWGIFGANKQKENRYQKFTQIVNEYNELIKNIPEKYTDEDYAEMQVCQDNDRSLYNQVQAAEYKSDVAKSSLSDVERMYSGFCDVNKRIVEYRAGRAAIYDKAKQRLQDKRKKQPVVISGYKQYSQDV